MDQLMSLLLWNKSNMNDHDHMKTCNFDMLLQRGFCNIKKFEIFSGDACDKA